MTGLQHKVCRLDVAMHHPVAVAGGNNLQDLVHHPGCSRFFQHTLLLHKARQQNSETTALEMLRGEEAVTVYTRQEMKILATGQSNSRPLAKLLHDDSQ